jgi:hypothetical protein
MKIILKIIMLLLIFNLNITAESLTVYNQGFALVKTKVQLELSKGLNEIEYSDITAHLEPESVILDNLDNSFKVLEQNYFSEPLTEKLLLSYYEGKTIEFETYADDEKEIVKGKIIRSGYVPHYSAWSQYNPVYAQRQRSLSIPQNQSTIIEVDNKLRFSLPGKPLFPELTDDSILKPVLKWKINSDKKHTINTDLSYITQGMKWKADYNVIFPETENIVNITGWVTIENHSGKNFDNVNIKLMAGDVNKIQTGGYQRNLMMSMDYSGYQPASVTEKSFDEYHLYNLNTITDLKDREMKQIEFLNVENIKAEQVLVYDGLKINYNNYRHYTIDRIRNDRNYGTEYNSKVMVKYEFENIKKNNLGLPLPKGQVRLYRKDNDDNKLEFIGEDLIDHTPENKKISIYTGDAFDLTGKRIRTNYHIESNRNYLTETFEITLNNSKNKDVIVKVVEHLYRGKNWKIMDNSLMYKKTDSKTIEFMVKLNSKSSEKISYTVEYTW